MKKLLISAASGVGTDYLASCYGKPYKPNYQRIFFAALFTYILLVIAAEL